MSAWMVSNRHIDYLLTAAFRTDTYGPLYWFVPKEKEQEGKEETLEEIHQRKRVLTVDSANEAGKMLLLQNALSVAHRYGEVQKLEDYKFRPYPTFDAVVALKQIDCYEYQSCETEDWERTEAKDFCDALRERLIDRLPGYDEAPWGID